MRMWQLVNSRQGRGIHNKHYVDLVSIEYQLCVDLNKLYQSLRCVISRFQLVTHLVGDS